MKEWLKKYHIIMRLFSLFIAFFLWFYVIYQENPEKSVSFQDVPVRLLNEETLKNRYNLVVVGEEDIAVTVKLSGTFSRLEDLSATDLRVTADLGKITEAGTYTLSYDIASVDGVTVVERSPADITVTVDEQISLELPVNVSISGNLSDGLVADLAIADPVTVRVSGLRSELADAVSAQVTVPASELTTSYSADLPFTVTDEAGKSIVSDSLELIDQTVHVEIPVYRERTLPLRLDVVYGNAANESNTNVALSRDSITVYGDIDTVNAMDDILIDTVDVSSFTGEYHNEYTIDLPDNVYVRGGDDTVTVDITYTDLETRQVVVTDIRIVNIPIRYTVKSDTAEVYVTVRGTPEQLDALVSGDIAVQADLTGVTLINGMQKVTATVLLGENVTDLGVFGDYSVVIYSEKLSGTMIFN
ncbi:MAG: CdaR family protein [Clostridiaceae bacterium]|nr:CdaR family protein [Clostridiaceae bacterium]